MMSVTVVRTVIAVLLIAHGLVHLSMALVPLPEPGGMRTPFWPSWWRSATDPQWFAAKMGLSAGVVQTAGWLLWVGSLVLYVLAGLGLFGFPVLNDIWVQLTLGGSMLSLLLFAFYWHPWMFVGAALSLAFLLMTLIHLPASLFAAS